MPFKESAIGKVSDRLTVALSVNSQPSTYRITHNREPILFLFSPKCTTFAAQLIFLNKIREMNNYELMVIFTPVLSEEDYKAAQNKFTAFVKENSGKLTHDNQ